MHFDPCNRNALERKRGLAIMMTKNAAYKVLPAILMLALAAGFEVRATAGQGGSAGIFEKAFRSGRMKTVASLYVPVKVVLQKIKAKQRVLLVDIRDKEAFERVRIPGSMHIPLGFIKTKAFLKNKFLVLVSAGYGQRFMEAECRRLNTLGFAAKILYGGLRCWKERGGALTGDQSILAGVNEISSRAFFQEKNRNSWMLVDASETCDAVVKALLPSAVHIPILTDPKGSLKKMRELSGRQKNHPFSGILIFNQTGAHYARIEKAIEGASLINVVYLHAGQKGYRDFLDHQSLSAKSRSARLRRVGPCDSCRQQGEPKPIAK